MALWKERSEALAVDSEEEEAMVTEEGKRALVEAENEAIVRERRW